MKKQILMISASPRKGGNSDALCDQFAKGAKEAGHTVEKVFLRDKTIHYCTACDYCRTSGGVCAHRDDMEELLTKMEKAQVIVLATPVYFYTMDAQLKTMIDRTVARYSFLKNKEFYFIATMADTDPKEMERTFEGLRGFTNCLSGAVERGALYGTSVWQKGDVQSTKLMREAYEMGKHV